VIVDYVLLPDRELYEVVDALLTLRVWFIVEPFPYEESRVYTKPEGVLERAGILPENIRRNAEI
jgi:hypothetical protein